MATEHGARFAPRPRALCRRWIIVVDRSRPDSKNHDLRRKRRNFHPFPRWLRSLIEVSELLTSPVRRCPDLLSGSLLEVLLHGPSSELFEE